MSAILNPTPHPVPSTPPDRLAPAPPHGAPSGGKKKSWIILALILAGAGAAYEFGYKPMQARQAQATAVVIPTVQVTRGTLEKRIRVAGATGARDYATVTAPMLRGPESNRPMILLTLVESGAPVKKGDLLAVIDGQGLVDHIDDVRDFVAAAEADVKKRKAELEIDSKNLEQTIQVAKADLDKARLDASAAEVRSEVERQLLQLASEEALARYNQLLGDIENTKKQHAADIGILNLTLERHKRHLARHENDLKRFTIHSPMDGLAVLQSVWAGGSMRTVALGDQVGPGQPFLKVVNPASMMLDAKVNQAESEMFRIGQPAEMKLDAFPGMTMKGKVFSIGAIATGGWRQNFFIRSVPIKIAFEGADSRLIPDLSGSADVVLDRVENALIVPLSAIKNENGKSLVAVKTKEGFAAHEVQVGLSNDTHASILSGINENTELRLR